MDELTSLKMQNESLQVELNKYRRKYSTDTTVNNYTCTDKETGISIKIWQQKDGALFRQASGLEPEIIGYRQKLTLDELRDFSTRELAAYLAGLGVKPPSPVARPAVECELCHDESGSEKCVRPAHQPNQPKANPTQDTGWKHMANLWQAKANVFECRVKELTAQLEDKDKTINALKSTLKGVERALLR